MALNLMYQDRDKYANELDKITLEIDRSDNGNKQLHLYSQPERLRIGTEVWAHPTTQMDLVYPFSPDQPNEREEVVLAIQGYVLKANLPPVSNNALVIKSPTTAKQSVILTGLGCNVFDECAKAILEIHTRLGAYLPNNTLEPWTSQTDEDCLCLELSNRYLTPDRLASVYESVPFDETMDPLGLLRGKDGSRRTEDNVVLYYERNMGPDNKYTYSSCNPVAIKPGHLVEAQVSFCAVPISKGRYLMLSKMRSLCILDAVVFKDLNNIAFEAMKSTPRPNNKRLKRKIGYNTETVNSNDKSTEDDTTQAMKKLRLNEKNGKVRDSYSNQPEAMEEC